MLDKHHKTATVIIGGIGAIVALITLYIAYDNHRDKKIQNDLVDLDKQIKELQLLKLKKEV